jgi:hypothetical protein
LDGHSVGVEMLQGFSELGCFIKAPSERTYKC